MEIRMPQNVIEKLYKNATARLSHQAESLRLWHLSQYFAYLAYGSNGTAEHKKFPKEVLWNKKQTKWRKMESQTKITDEMS